MLNSEIWRLYERLIQGKKKSTSQSNLKYSGAKLSLNSIVNYTIFTKTTISKVLIQHGI